MKASKYLIGLITALAVLSSCKQSFEAPPLTEPKYTGAPANMTIAELKTMYAGITDPTLIETDYILNATVTGNDVSGNIYKQLFIQDKTGGINMGVDQNSVYTEYRVGQEIYVHLKGLYMVMYGDQLQIGYNLTNANRISWEMFQYHVFKDKWPLAANAVPKVIKLNEFTDADVNTLVKFENVYFVDGGKLSFSTPDATTNRTLKDGNGNEIIVRNSNYASFSADILPEGGGNVVGILSKYRSDWQFYLRTKDDCYFPGLPIPGGDGGGTDPDVTTYYSETFGTENVDARPYIADYTGYDNKTVTYSDASGGASIRTTKKFTTPHVWFPSGKDTYLTITGIDTSGGTGEELSLNYELIANLYNPGESMNVNAVSVSVDGTALAVPSKELSNTNGDHEKIYKISLKGVPAKSGLVVEFHSSGTGNTFGFRLDNVTITTATEGEEIIEPK